MNFNLHLHRDQRGVSAVIVALMLSLLLVCTAIVIDGGRLFLNKSAGQAALDASTLAAAKVTPAEWTNEANNIFRVNFKTDIVPFPQVTITQLANGNLRGTVQITSKTLFASMLHIPQTTANLSTEVAFTAPNNVQQLAVAFDVSAQMGLPVTGGEEKRIDVVTQELQTLVNNYYSGGGGAAKYISLISYNDTVRIKLPGAAAWIEPRALPSPLPPGVSPDVWHANMGCMTMRKGKSTLLTDDPPTTLAGQFPLYLGAMQFPSELIARAFDFNGGVVNSFNGTNTTYVKPVRTIHDSYQYLIGVKQWVYTSPFTGLSINLNTGNEPLFQQVAGGARNNRIEYDPMSGRGESVSVSMAPAQGFFQSGLMYDLTGYGPGPFYYRYPLTPHGITQCFKDVDGGYQTGACQTYTYPVTASFSLLDPQFPTYAGYYTPYWNRWDTGWGDSHPLVEYKFIASDNGMNAANNTKIAYNFYYTPMCFNKDSLFLEKDKTKAYNYLTNFYQCDLPASCGLLDPDHRQFIGGITRTDRGIAWLMYSYSQKWKGLLNPSEPTQPKGSPDPGQAALLIAHGDNQVPVEDDANTLALCTKLKGMAVTVYTIAFDASPATQNLMQQCASSGKYYGAADRTELRKVLGNIAGNSTSPSSPAGNTVRLVK